MRQKYLLIHCTATPEGKDYTKKQILNWFTNRGWKNPGYREVIHLDGTFDVLQPYNSDLNIHNTEITNGAMGFNEFAVHVSYIGGMDKNHDPKDTRTDLQKKSLIHYCWNHLFHDPELIIGGHNQINPYKACPSFNVPEWLRSIGVSEKNILPEKPSPQILSNSNYYLPFDFTI